MAIFTSSSALFLLPPSSTLEKTISFFHLVKIIIYIPISLRYTNLPTIENQSQSCLGQSYSLTLLILAFSSPNIASAPIKDGSGANKL